MVNGLRELFMDVLAMGIAWYVVFIISVTFHEAAHGFAAAKLGDPTAYHHGLVSLDPIPHIRRSPFGMVVVPLLSFILGGWMVGWASTPIDPYWARYHRRQSALVSSAGPAANLLLILVAAIIIRGGLLAGVFYAPEEVTFERVTAVESAGFANSTAIIVSILFSLNLILLVFNLIPFPPLDGSNILLFFLKDPAAYRYETFLSNPAHMVIGLVIAWNLFDYLFLPIHTLALNILYPGAGYH